MNNEKAYALHISKVYLLLVSKTMKKGHTQAEIHLSPLRTESQERQIQT